MAPGRDAEGWSEGRITILGMRQADIEGQPVLEGSRGQLRVQPCGAMDRPNGCSEDVRYHYMAGVADVAEDVIEGRLPGIGAVREE